MELGILADKRLYWRETWGVEEVEEEEEEEDWALAVQLPQANTTIHNKETKETAANFMIAIAFLSFVFVLAQHVDDDDDGNRSTQVLERPRQHAWKNPGGKEPWSLRMAAFFVSRRRRTMVESFQTQTRYSLTKTGHLLLFRPANHDSGWTTAVYPYPHARQMKPFMGQRIPLVTKWMASSIWSVKEKMALLESVTSMHTGSPWVERKTQQIS